MIFAYLPLENTLNLCSTFWRDVKNNKKDHTPTPIKVLKLFGRLTFISINLAGDAAAMGVLAVASLKPGPLERYKKLFQVTCVSSRALLCFVSMVYSGVQLYRQDELGLFHDISSNIRLKGESKLLRDEIIGLHSSIEQRLISLEDDMLIRGKSRAELLQKLDDLTRSNNQIIENGRKRHTMAIDDAEQLEKNISANQWARQDRQIKIIRELLTENSNITQSKQKKPEGLDSEEKRFLASMFDITNHHKDEMKKIVWSKVIDQQTFDLLDNFKWHQKNLLTDISKLHSLSKKDLSAEQKKMLERVIEGEECKVGGLEGCKVGGVEECKAVMEFKMINMPDVFFQKGETPSLERSIYALVFRRHLSFLISALCDFYVFTKAAAAWDIIWPLSKAKIRATPLIWQLAAVETIALIAGGYAFYVSRKKAEQTRYGNKEFSIYH